MSDAKSDPRYRLDGDIRPQIAVRSGGLPLWAIGLAMLVAGIALFSVLNARRRGAEAPTVSRQLQDEATVAAQATPLFVPPESLQEPIVVVPPASPAPIPSKPIARAIIPAPADMPRGVLTPLPTPTLAVSESRGASATSGPALIIDTGEASAPSPATTGNGDATGNGAASASAAAPARATLMGHRSTLVAQGTLIPAVLETALDSTRGGPSRALVTRDVQGFDGTTVLIPRGSRLFGDSHSDVQPGQNRALIMWTRLIRPDGVTIAIGSPSADPLGRIGVRGKVNSHFFERFSGAILQSALNVGVNLASQAANRNSPVVVALPSTVQSTTQPLTSGSQIQPTLRVKQGTAITVFVARDLDFTAVQARQ